jgi:hypothetical protein
LNTHAVSEHFHAAALAVDERHAILGRSDDATTPTYRMPMIYFLDGVLDGPDTELECCGHKL